jgi:hypothetical protein
LASHARSHIESIDRTLKSFQGFCLESFNDSDLCVGVFRRVIERLKLEQDTLAASIRSLIRPDQDGFIHSDDIPYWDDLLSFIASDSLSSRLYPYKSFLSVD